MAMQWYIKREVNMVSTVHTGEMTDTGKTNFRTHHSILKQDLVIDCTQNVLLVDKSNMMVSFIDCMRKTIS